jgi:adenine/guanine/hypoxanthine permease
MLLFALALFLTAILLARGVRGALLIGMAVATAAAVAAQALLPGGAGFAPGVARLPAAVFSAPRFDQVGQFGFGFVSALGLAPAALVVFSVMLSDFFDTVGTVVAVGQEARYLDAEGNFPRPGAVLLVDSLAAVGGGALGASSATTYVESAAGAAAGGRTGLTAVVCGVLFALCLGFAPVASVVPPQATGAVLVLVGFLMMRDVGAIPWGDATEAIPAFLTLTVMPFTYSITNGVGAGFVSYAALKLLAGRGRELHPLLAGSALAFVAYFVASRA